MKNNELQNLEEKYGKNPEKYAEEYFESLLLAAAESADEKDIKTSDNLFKEALKTAQKEFDKNPEKWREKYLVSLCKYGHFCNKNGYIEKAEKLYKKAIETIDNSSFEFETLMNLYNILNKLFEVEKSANEDIKIESDVDNLKLLEFEIFGKITEKLMPAGAKIQILKEFLSNNENFMQLKDNVFLYKNIQIIFGEDKVVIAGEYNKEKALNDERFIVIGDTAVLGLEMEEFTIDELDEKVSYLLSLNEEDK